MKKQVEIKVMGQKLVIRSDSDEDYISRVADFVDSKIQEVTKTSNTVTSLNIAILAAMNIADEFLRYKHEKEKQAQDAEKKIRGVIELIELQT